MRQLLIAALALTLQATSFEALAADCTEAESQQQEASAKMKQTTDEMSQEP